ncbi:hypothetical protein QBC34DRAFT_89237 [Podospora aff. communis PSN243]|uniref:Uncharacterized protein n=1 Tax=Podospora aff. communis PSN243 TaxID=3040156 RepID=A0AAV9GNQ8_9PEZI|nr:hypothetical protein QBC34DRAFT_89237 [Podospora aff. communis PSN243]
MPRFSVAFGRRKSTADTLENGSPAGEPSFRVLERSEVSTGGSFDGGLKLAAKSHQPPRRSGSVDVAMDDNIFSDLKPNRGSGSASSNTTKTASTDNSSRHSNSSTTPSSADLGNQEEWRQSYRRTCADIPVPPIPKSSSTGFLKAAGRTFSFGGQKKHMPSMPSTEEDQAATFHEPDLFQAPPYGRSRATTSSTATTVTAPRVDDVDLDMGGDFSKILLGNDKRASVATVKPGLAPRALTVSRATQPAPIQIDNGTKVEAAPHSWSSHHSNDQLLNSTSPSLPQQPTESAPPPVPHHTSLPGNPGRTAAPSSRAGSRRPSFAHNDEGEDEEERLLRDSLSTVNRFMSGKQPAAATPSTSRYRRNEDHDDEDSLFDTSHTYSARSANRFASPRSSPQQNHKVMTPAEFESYRKDKERQDKERREDTYNYRPKADDDDDDHDNYEEDEDDLEKAKQQAKQRRKQEAHLSVYRQQMMKVTGEAANATRPSLQISFSTPNLPNLPSLNPGPSPEANTADNSDEDEEVPLAILAAHGFPNRNRAPTRLSTMMSNPNLRAAAQPSYQRPSSAMGEGAGPSNPRLPAFARNLPQDPFLGAGLIRNSVRESFALGGGQPGAAVPPGGLIGVIANEERSRAMRRGSPQYDPQNPVPGAVPFDPVGGIPANMMYQNHAGPSLTPGDQAQIQMTQQMQQFMQMQMQFMQMMAGQNGNGPSPGAGHMAAQSMGNLSTMSGMSAMGGMPMRTSTLGVPGAGGPEMMRHSFVGNDSLLDLPRGDMHMRTMSMVQPSSASWIQLPQNPNPGFAPSIRIQGGGYAPSIAPSERSNIGLPGRYRPVSHAPPPVPNPGHLRKSSTMSGAIPPISVTKSGAASDEEDDEEGWEAMKAKRDKKKSLWKTKKSIGGDIGAFIR